MNTPDSRKILGRTFLEWFSSLPVFALLLLTLIVGTGEMVHGQLLKLGEHMFGDAQVQYFMLRADPVKPDCNPHVDIEAEVARQREALAATVNELQERVQVRARRTARQAAVVAGIAAAVVVVVIIVKRRRS